MARFHQHEWDMLPERSFQPRGWKGSMTLEGGKGGDMPAPDPELIAAQIKSMGIQDSAIQQIMNNANAMMPLQKEQMQFGLDTARTAYDQSQQDRTWMLDRRGSLSGLQDQLVDDARSFNTEARRNQLAAEANADVGQAFGLQRQQTNRNMSRMGVNPNSGKFAAMTGQMDMAEASAKASAANKTRQAARMEGMAMTDRATNALAGYPAMSMQATSAGAGYGAAGTGIANQGLAGMNSGFGAASTAAGQMGQNATNMWGQQANAYNQSQQSGDSFGSILGGIGGLAMGMGPAGFGMFK